MRSGARLALLLAVLAFGAYAAPAYAVTVCPSGCDATTIQGGVTAAAPGDTVEVAAGTYEEDVTVNKAALILEGDGAGTTTIRGPIGGGNATVHVTAADVIIDGFTITRAGNNTTDWNDPGLNLTGVAVQSVGDSEIRNCRFIGNRTGIDINNSNGNSIHNNVIEDNRTGLVFRNQTDNTTLTENRIVNNWTIGVLFLDASGGTNAPVQSALNSTFGGNDISGNWYGQIEDRQSGGSLPAPGTTNKKDFSGNWFGTASPSVTTNPAGEPGYASQIPPLAGGTAAPPGGKPEIAGTASANFDFTPLLRSGTDTDGGEFGFQGDFSQLTVTTGGAQVQTTGRIQEGIDRATVAGTVHVLAGTFAENTNVNKDVDVTGAGATTIIDPAVDGPALQITASGSVVSPLTISSLRTTGATGGGNTGSGLAITAPVTDVRIADVRSNSNSGHGLAVNVATGADLARLDLDGVRFNSNAGSGLRFPTSMGSLTGLTIDDSQFDLNTMGLELNGPPSTEPVTSVSITDSSLSQNANKGMYVERLDDATLDNLTVDESGTNATPHAAGIDLNLKKQAFTDIALTNSEITDSGTGDPVNGVGIAIKSRDDGSNGPTSVTGVTLTGNTITGNQRGIRLGEPAPATPNSGPSDVHINRNAIAGNTSGGIVNVTQTPADAECNWWGAANGPAPTGSGDSVSSGVDFDPWLVTADLNGSCVAPTANADTGTTDEDTPLTVAAPGVLGNDTNPENRTLTAQKASDPTNGTVTVNSNGGYTYTPNANYNGPDSFTYKANDGTRDSNTATVSITVTAVNDAPVAANDSGSVAEDGTLTVAAADGVLDNDSDVESQPLTAAKVADPAHGTVTLNGDGSYTYTPAADYSGPDSFTYKANDGSADSNTTTVSIAVTGTPDAPVAADDSASVNEDGTLTVAGDGVLGNDSDADGDPLTATLVSNVSNGTLTLDSDGSYTYAPNPNHNGTDSFTYRANDGSADSNTATVTIAVNEVAETPPAETEDVLAPVFVNARLTRTRFAPERSVIPAGTRRVKRGTRLVYSLSEAADVEIRIQRRRANGSFRRVGTLTTSGAEGSNRFYFSGKIGDEPLRRGRYRMALRATDAAGNQAVPKRLRFRMAPARG
jgi:VCBS repeat-containing protein/parallel beta-helix repeat protein